MAESFLTLMAELDDETQRRLSAWYQALREAGFTGTQTPGLAYHISLAAFPLEKEQEAVAVMRGAAGRFSTFPVHLSHVGIFAPGKVLFAAPDISAELAALHDACAAGERSPYPWTPHVTLLMDEPGTIAAAVPVFLKSFAPLLSAVTRLRLCAFWPMREVAVSELTGRPTVSFC